MMVRALTGRSSVSGGASISGTSLSSVASHNSLEAAGTSSPLTVPVTNACPPTTSIPVPQRTPELGTPSDAGSFELVSLPDFSALSVPSRQPDSPEDSPDNLPVFLRGSPGGDMVCRLTKENRELVACLAETNSLLARLEREQQQHRENFLRIRHCLQAKKENSETNGAFEDANVKVSRKESKKDKNKSDKKNAEEKLIKNGVGGGDVQFQSVQIQNLSSQLDVAEDAQAQLSQDLQRVTGEKLEAQNQGALLGQEVERLKGVVEQLNKEKWELNAVNNDLQQRLQQTVALAHMQAEGNQSRLQEEVGRMLFQLEEERKVTANLSRNLELERRKVESLEQKAKSCGLSSGSNRGSSKGEKRRSSLVPEEVLDCEARLSQSMELYRQRCDNLGVSLASCQEKLEDERFCGDLATEVTKLRKLLTEEKRKSYGENTKLTEAHQLFEQVYLDYSAVIENVRQSQQDKKMKSQQQSVLTNIAESNMRDNVDSMTARLMQSEEALQQERAAHQEARDRLAQAVLDLEALPLLKAQVEVYQSDFNAERAARERIAGEKADLEEQMRKAGKGDQLPQRAPPPPRDQGLPPRGELRGDLQPLNTVRDRVNSLTGGRREDHFPNIPRTVNTRPEIDAEQNGPENSFPCPKCNREFRNTTLLTRHVNDCLDRDY